MFNEQLSRQLDKVLKEKHVKLKYPKGYKKWRAKFYSTLRETKGDVNQTLEKIHGKPSKSNNSK